MHQQSGHRRIDAAGESTDDPLAADALANLRHGLLDGRAGRPGGFTAADAKEEVADDGLALWSVRHFGVKLQAHQTLRAANGGDRIALAASQQAETRREFIDAIAVAHPDRQAQGRRARTLPLRGGVDTLEDAIEPLIAGDGGRHLDGGRAILARPLSGRDVSAELQGQQLHPVADAQYWQAAAQDRRIAGRRMLVVDAGRAAGENEALDVEMLILSQLRQRRARGHKLTIDMTLAHAPRNEAAVL